MWLLFILFMIAASVRSEDYESYSYQKFRGPVSGQIQRVELPAHYHHKAPVVDYIAKPDYGYSYSVQDPVNGNSQTHEESRDGDAVTGEYRVLQADGIVRIVKYVADATNGFRATITYEQP